MAQCKWFAVSIDELGTCRVECSLRFRLLTWVFWCVAELKRTYASLEGGVSFHTLQCPDELKFTSLYDGSRSL